MPGHEASVVVDTTPLIALSLIGRLGLLEALYHRVIIPPAVRAEIEAGGERSPSGAELDSAPWISTVPLEDSGPADLLVDLDRGEAEVIALARERGARLVILDERLGRRHAMRLGMRVTGTLGVLLLAKRTGEVQELRPLVETLHNGGIHLGPALIQEALRLAGE